MNVFLCVYVFEWQIHKKISTIKLLKMSQHTRFVTRRHLFYAKQQQHQWQQ